MGTKTVNDVDAEKAVEETRVTGAKNATTIPGLKGRSTREEGALHCTDVPKAEFADIIVVGDMPNGVPRAGPLEGTDPK